MTAIITFPQQPTTLDEARSYLAWIADAALQGAVDFKCAGAATKAVEAWIRCENYGKQIRDLQKEIKALQKREARRVTEGD